MNLFTITYSNGSRSRGVLRSASSLSIAIEPPHVLVLRPVRIGYGPRASRVCLFFSRQAKWFLSLGPKTVVDRADAARRGLERKIGVYKFQCRAPLFLRKVRIAKIGLDGRNECLEVARRHDG